VCTKRIGYVERHISIHIDKYAYSGIHRLYKWTHQWKYMHICTGILTKSGGHRTMHAHVHIQKQIHIQEVGGT